MADKKARELQALNAQLVGQLRDGESQLQQKSNDLKRMKTEQERADRVIRDLARKSGMNRQEIDGFRNELEAERRQTSANQEGLGRKVKTMEEEKRRLEEKIRGENERAKPKPPERGAVREHDLARFGGDHDAARSEVEHRPRGRPTDFTDIGSAGVHETSGRANVPPAGILTHITR